MFHLVLVLLPLILISILLSIFLFGVSSVLISLFGGTAAILLIKDKKARTMLLLGFVVLSLIGALCLFPFVAAYAELPPPYYSLITKGLLGLIALLSFVELFQAHSLKNKLLKYLIFCLFVVVLLAVIFLILLQLNR